MVKPSCFSPARRASARPCATRRPIWPCPTLREQNRTHRFRAACRSECCRASCLSHRLIAVTTVQTWLAKSSWGNPPRWIFPLTALGTPGSRPHNLSGSAQNDVSRPSSLKDAWPPVDGAESGDWAGTAPSACRLCRGRPAPEASLAACRPASRLIRSFRAPSFESKCPAFDFTTSLSLGNSLLGDVLEIVRLLPDLIGIGSRPSGPCPWVRGPAHGGGRNNPAIR